jgi:hypothetical protein
MSKRSSGLAVMAALSLGLAAGGFALAQDPPKRPQMGHRMMSGGGMMGMGGMGCPMVMPGADMKVEKIANGISISFTSSDPKVASRIQKRGDIMRLMHELREEESQSAR